MKGMLKVLTVSLGGLVGFVGFAYWIDGLDVGDGVKWIAVLVAGFLYMTALSYVIVQDILSVLREYRMEDRRERYAHRPNQWP